MKSSKSGFQGSRLREAREARALTATALSELVDVSTAAISQYENDHHSPSPQVMAKLADKLNVPSTLFLKPPRPDCKRVVFWRAQSAATKLQRARSSRRHEWLHDVVDMLTAYIDFPPVDFPDLNLQGDPLLLDFDDIEEIALRVREIWSLGNGPIGNLVSLLERHGAIIARTRIDTERLDAFSEWRLEDGRPYITLTSDKESAARSRMDAAHELGHMLLHKNVSLKDFNKLAIHSHMEKQVKRFASAFLLPAETFVNDLFSYSLDAFRDLKPRWRVSISAMIYRASDLGLLSENQSKRLWINMARRKWRKREPGDDRLLPEEPQLLKQAFDMLLNNGVIDTHAMEPTLGLRIRDIESVSGLPDRYLQDEGISTLKFRLEND